MQVQTFTSAYPDAKHRRYDQELGQRIRIRHDILDAVQARCPKGMTLKAFINQTLSEHFL